MLLFLYLYIKDRVLYNDSKDSIEQGKQIRFTRRKWTCEPYFNKIICNVKICFRNPYERV